MNIANIYAVNNSKILQTLLAGMVNLAVVIKLIINQSYKQFSKFLWDQTSKIAIFSLLKELCPDVI